MIIKARLNQINVLTFGVKSDYLPSELLVELQEFVLHSLDQIWNHACFLFIYFFLTLTFLQFLSIYNAF